MADTAVQRMTADAFLQWCLTEEGRWELVNGIPVPLHGAEMMSGAKRVHDLITGNIFAGLHARLKGGPYRPYTAGFRRLFSARECRLKPAVRRATYPP